MAVLSLLIENDQPQDTLRSAPLPYSVGNYLAYREGSDGVEGKAIITSCPSDLRCGSNTATSFLSSVVFASFVLASLLVLPAHNKGLQPANRL